MRARLFEYDEGKYNSNEWTRGPVTAKNAATTPKRAVVEYLLRRYEYHCEREQLERAGEAPMLWCVHEGTAGWDPTPIERAEDHHRAALLLLWSMDAEQQDPSPPGLPT